MDETEMTKPEGEMEETPVEMPGMEEETEEMPAPEAMPEEGEEEAA